MPRCDETKHRGSRTSNRVHWAAAAFLGLAACAKIDTLQFDKPTPPSLPIQVASTLSPPDYLVHMVKPVIPRELRKPYNQTVSLNCTIGEDGRVEECSVRSGLDDLAPFALKAVKQWRYKPMFLYDLLDGKSHSVKVKTLIELTFPRDGRTSIGR